MSRLRACASPGDSAAAQLATKTAELRNGAAGSGGLPITRCVLSIWQDDMGGTRSRKYQPHGNFRVVNARALRRACSLCVSSCAHTPPSQNCRWPSVA